MKTLLYTISLLFVFVSTNAQTGRTTADFDKGWRFHLGDIKGAEKASAIDKAWRMLDLPHDWSIEGKFDKDNPATPGGGALPGGIGWYRKTFTVPLVSKGKQVYIYFDGVYQHSDVWINGHHLGFRPNGYISFRYDLSKYLNYGGVNVVAVKVDNSKQPNSRWYSGSGIYRNVWLITTNGEAAISHWGTYVTTPKVSDKTATVSVETNLVGKAGAHDYYKLVTSIVDLRGKIVKNSSTTFRFDNSQNKSIKQNFTIHNPKLWSVDRPILYKAISKLYIISENLNYNNDLIDNDATVFGIRSFSFDADKGFFLNGKSLKILGVCNHHDLGALGAAINTRALERQLQILKGMGINGIRTTHNPPAPELLDLCDRMGFIVMDEAFDMWKAEKNKYDYHLYWDEWHKRDLQDQILRDRNHPSVFIWSIGNEIGEQYDRKDTIGRVIARELAAIVRTLDNRPITAANNDPDPASNIIASGALDLIGYNYHHQDYESFHKRYPGKKFIATETTSALQTRGHYDMPSDSIRRWPVSYDKPFTTGNPDNTVSAYDNVSAPWGSTHEETWKVMKRNPMLSGMYIWTGFDYLGEPTPYSWPSRSSYFGVVDLAGFPKDVYYMYKSEWTNQPVLHIFPHWNWEPGKTVDVWAYYNNADEVELYLNGKSVGIKKKTGEDLHVMWRLNYEPGTLKAVSRKDGKTVLTKIINTAGAPARIELSADRSAIKADGKDLSFVTVRILDKDGNLVPKAANKVSFSLSGPAKIAGVDNGDPVSHDPFKASWRKAFNGLALAIIQGSKKPGTIKLTATADGLVPATVIIESK